MNTQVLTDVAAAAEILRGGGLVAFPTETVYGLGADGLNPAALEKIFVAKGRPHSDPLILHVAELEQVRELVAALPPTALRLAEAFWPGPLTLVLPRSAKVPDLVTAGLDSVAVRMPDHPVARALIQAAGVPLAAPSANRFSRPSPTTAAHVLQDLDGRIEAVLDGGPTRVGVESTIVDLRGETPVVIRPGGIPREVVESVVGTHVPLLSELGVEALGRWGVGGKVPVDPGTTPQEAQVAPGLLTKHYSPRAEVFLFEGVDAAVLPEMVRLAEAADTAVLAFAEDRAAFAGRPALLFNLGSRTQLEHAARALYGLFREADVRGAARIAARMAPPGGLGDAINDRLRRAASGRVLRPGS